MSGDPHVIHVATPDGAYDALVGRGLLDSLGSHVASVLAPSAACIVTDSNVGPLYGARAQKSLEAAGIPTRVITFAAGEQNKRHQTLFDILERMAGEGITRDGCVIALGGGVTGDMAGLAAALYLRGIPVVQVPTSLLAMVDSSVGGKTAIDLEAGKNLAGAFLQPSLVLADPDVLVTLPRRQLRDSCGEIVKHAAIADEGMLEEITREPIVADSLDLDRLGDLIARNIDIKRSIVEIDVREAGIRQVLNFGHTMGHAIEAASGFKLGHGTCVGIGMCAMERAATALGWSADDVLPRIEAALEAQGLPLSSSVDTRTALAFAGHDKKRRGAGVNLAIVDAIGHATTRSVGFGEFERIVELGLAPSGGSV